MLMSSIEYFVSDTTQYTQEKKRNISIALWLVANTKLKPEQIAQIANIHLFEAILLHKKLCDFDYTLVDPVKMNIISQEQITEMESRCSNSHTDIQKLQKRYIPKPLRKYIPGSVMWLHQQYPKISTKVLALYTGSSTKKIQQILSDDTIEPINPLLVQLIDQKMLENMMKST